MGIAAWRMPASASPQATAKRPGCCRRSAWSRLAASATRRKPASQSTSAPRGVSWGGRAQDMGDGKGVWRLLSEPTSVSFTPEAPDPFPATSAKRRRRSSSPQIFASFSFCGCKRRKRSAMAVRLVSITGAFRRSQASQASSDACRRSSSDRGPPTSRGTCSSNCSASSQRCSARLFSTAAITCLCTGPSRALA